MRAAAMDDAKELRALASELEERERARSAELQTANAFLNSVIHPALGSIGIDLGQATMASLELMIFGGLIIFFLIVEPNGLARLWQIAKEKLRLWPFPH